MTNSILSDTSDHDDETSVSTSFGRRSFITSAAVAGFGAALGFQALAAKGVSAAQNAAAGGGYGPLRPVRDESTGLEILQLPKGFEYVSFGRTGEIMDDGIPTPGAHDGMAAFRRGNTVRLVRNHEQGSGPAYATGMTYDPAAAGGTTNLTFDTRWGNPETSYASLAGTIRNCAGGPTPWGSWLSCEETTQIQGSFRHGYVFEVPSDGPSSGEPIKGMGRYSHEAAAVDPETGWVYLSEDATPSGLYRFKPRRYGDFTSGGVLQMAKIGSGSTVETYGDDTGQRYGRLRWVRIDDPDATEESCVAQGIAQGGAVFSRGEGLWYGDRKIYFISTDGGPVGEGQVFELDLRSGELHVLYASPSEAVLDNPDNVTVSPRDGIVLCEDGDDQQYLRGLTPDGEIFDFCLNNLNTSEFAGATFEPRRGKWLFVNIQSPGITLAITGPWSRGAL